jgi:hypothetical protein
MRVAPAFLVAALSLLALPTGAQQPPPPPPPPQAIDTPDFLFLKRGPLAAILRTDMPYQIGQTTDSIIVPAGFVTDFASIPRPLWASLSPVDDYKLAAVVHDYLYWFQPCTRQEADNLLVIAMTEEGVAERYRTSIYRGLRLGGAQAWNGNRAKRDAGEIKIVPLAAGRPGALESWADFQVRLRAAGVSGAPGRMSRQKYCDYGKSQKVP